MSYADPRARDLGVTPGNGTPGEHNAITDVPGVLVGHKTVIEGDGVRTGATAIFPHNTNIYQAKVPAGLSVMNGYGKFAGATQIEELGELETPILLTNTLSVAAGMQALIDWTLNQPGNESVRSVNAVVGETNDGRLNAIRAQTLTPLHMKAALENAMGGPVPEGNVGAGTGTIAMGWKGGIGTSSRLVDQWTVGVLVQTNFGGSFVMDGIPVGDLIGQQGVATDTRVQTTEHGSIVIVLATDAPLSSRNLKRLAGRAFAGLARSGANLSNGSGDYAIAFSTAESVRRDKRSAQTLANDEMTPLFVAAAAATEEAIVNAALAAEDMQSHDEITGELRTVRALPSAEVKRIIAEYRK
ncbi:MAG: P1 family peptidase [Pseudomonadota bacterium]